METPRRQATPRAPRRVSPVAPKGLGQAAAVARSFADSYLPVANGQARTSSLIGVTPTLRLELSRGSARVTPDERRRPRVVSVETGGQEPGFVLATAVVGDGGVATYSLRMVVQTEGRGWVVTELVGG